REMEETVEEIMRLHRSLPQRPGIEEVEAAKSLIRNVDKEEQSRLEAVSRHTAQKKRSHPEIPKELLLVLQEMHRNLVYFQSEEQKREALKLLALENLHSLFDDLIQRASNCLPSSSSSSSSSSASASATASSLSQFNSSSSSSAATPAVPSASTSTFNHSLHESQSRTELFTRDDTYLKKTKPKPTPTPTSFFGDAIGFGTPIPSASPQILDPILKPFTSPGQQVSEKLSLIKLASLIEVSLKKGIQDLNLHNKLLDQIEWLPDSVGRLSTLISLDLSENHVVALPPSIGGLSSLQKLDLHSNRIAELPETIADLLNLVCLDLRGNQLTGLPANFGRLARLEELDLSSNSLSVLPESIGSLISLKKLKVETNDIEEIPHTIGRCSSLLELHADYNRLKALPEAVGKIECLVILSVRYNNIKQLPSTMSSLTNLRELDVSFNELEAVPESLCFATTITKMNISNNFADLKYLPRSIGNLEMLEELDISNNQIRVLPDSFRMLSHLCILCVDGNPLEVPPLDIAEKGAQVVVQYMADLVANRGLKSQPVRQKKTWMQMCIFSRSNKRKRDGLDYMKA
ncbi:Leucine-rich repeat, partial [Dillenia turbinata]